MCPSCGAWGRQKHRPSMEPVIVLVRSKTRHKIVYDLNSPPRKVKCPGCGKDFETKVAENEDGYVGLCEPCENKNGSKRDYGKTHFISDADWQDGRTGDVHYQPAFGKHARSKRDIREMQKRTRENLWKDTDGAKTYMVRDKESGEMGKVTVEGRGIDSGEIHTSEDNKGVRAPDLKKMAVDDFKKAVMAKVTGKGK